MAGTAPRLVAAALVAAAGWAAWGWLWPDEDARIRAALTGAAARLSIPAGEPPVARLARVSGLRDDLAPDVVVEGPAGLRLDGADRVVAAAAARLQGTTAGGDVRLVDLEVTRTADSAAAEVHGVVEIQSGDGARDAREVVFGMRRDDGGRWRISRVTLVDPLERPPPAR